MAVLMAAPQRAGTTSDQDAAELSKEEGGVIAGFPLETLTPTLSHPRSDSYPSPTVAMSTLSDLWRTACNDYAKQTGIALTDKEFPQVSGPEDLSRRLDAEDEYFQDFRTKKRPLFHAMQSILAPFENWGALLGDVASAAFPPTSSIMGAMLLLVQAARKVSESFDMISDLFQKLGHFALRLDSYKGVPLTEGMKTIIVKVLVNFLRVCAVSQKLIRSGSLRARLSKWAKNVFIEDTSVTSLLGELEELTSQEHKMISAQGLNLTYQALKNTTELIKRDDTRNNRETLDRVKSGLNPVPASGQVLSAISGSRIPETGSWIEDRIRSWWEESSQPLLWIHGGPGVGKSYMASKIINDLAANTYTSIVASFFCKNNDVDLRSVNKALRTLAWQVATHDSAFAAHAEEFCLKEDPSDSYVVWRKLVFDYFTGDHFTVDESEHTVCFIIDGIDEIDVEEQETLLTLLEGAYGQDGVNQVSPVRFVLLSRDSLRGGLEEHSLEWEDIEINNDQSKDDLYKYISQKLHRASLFKGSPDLLEEIVTAISKSAEGLWEWANLVIKSVLRCRTKGQIRQCVKTMPRGISAMLREELHRLSRELSVADGPPDEFSNGEEGAASQIQHLNFILSLVAMAQKPLAVEHLELMLEIFFEDEVLNLEDDIRTVFSSLFSLRPAGDDEDYIKKDIIVTLRHSSFYEFFQSSVDTGLIHIDPKQSEATFVMVLLRAFQDKFAPQSERWLGAVKRYAFNFLPVHLTRADKEMVSNNLRDKISTLLADLFRTDPGSDRSFISPIYDRGHLRYTYYPGSRVTQFAQYWWGSGDRDTTNERAQLVLDWLLPDSRVGFEDSSRSLPVTSECPFTVLFSPMAVSLSSLWLAPGEIDEQDGLPWAIPLVLNVYSEMAGTAEISDSAYVDYGEGTDDISANTTKPVGRISRVEMQLPASRILLIAALQQQPETPIWHARVAQALLQHWHHQEALDRFQTSLDEDKKNPVLSSQSLHVIYRDMARAYIETGRYTNALEYSALAESLAGNPGNADAIRGNYGHLLNTAQMEYHAKLPAKAIATANKAWQAFVENKDDWDWELWIDFLAIFLELEQPHRLRPVLDHAFASFQEICEAEPESREFWRIEPIFSPRHVLYRALHIVLTDNDKEYLDLFTSIADMIDSQVFKYGNINEMKYFLGSVLFEKGRLNTGIRNWYEAATLTNDNMKWQIKSAQERSRSHLAALCLYHPDLPFCGQAPVKLDDEAEFGDICLIISSWLRGHGDIVNARKALCGRMKKSISMLRGDDDIDAQIILFKTFLIADNSDEDLSGVLYLLKRALRPSGENPKVSDPDSTAAAENNTDKSAQAVDKEYDDSLVFTDNDYSGYLGNVDPLTECANCKLQVRSVSYWYFCRSCPHSALCQRCYRDIKSAKSPNSHHATLSQHVPGICSPQHEFYYTGKPFLSSECADANVVTLTTPDGRSQTISTEQWKDRLQEKWETEDFEFEGGLSSWCMRVLPEPQRSRWAVFFEV